MARPLAAAIVLLGVLSACGSAAQRGFHSPTQTYSVHEVEVVFSQHGLPLRKAQSQRLPGVTALVHGRGSGSVSIQVAPPDSTLYAVVWEKGPRPRREQNRNVYVSFPAASSVAVRASLAALH